MSQKKPFNRFPNICPAGKHVVSSGTVSDCFKQYCTQEHVDALKHEAKIVERESFNYKLPPTKNWRHIGIYTESRPLLRPEVKTKYRTLVGDLKETGSHTYWTHNLGKARDVTGSLPSGYNTYTQTCGIPTKRVDLREIVNPSKTHGQVFNEYVTGHDLYIKSHNSYYTNEQINRKYKPPFNVNNVFGLPSPNNDNRGCLVKDCCTSKTSNSLNCVSDRQAECLTKKYPIIGKKCETKSHLPEDHAYGLELKRNFLMSEVLTDTSYPEIKRQVETFMCFLTQLRMKLKDRFNRRLLFFDDLFMSLKHYDQDKNGLISLTDCYEVCTCFRIFFTKSIMESYLRFMKILKDDKVNYGEFMNVLNWQNKLPDIGNAYHVKLNNCYYETSYNAFLNDYKIIDNSKRPTAGITSHRYDLMDPIVPLGGCRADVEHLGSETTVEILTNPTIYTSYGLTFTDFLLPRKKDVMKRLFIKIGYIFDDNEFEQFWSESLEIDRSKDGLVCVDTFKKVLDKHACHFRIH